MAEEENKEAEGGGESAPKVPMVSKMGIIVFAVFLLVYTAGMVFVLKPKAAPSEAEMEKKETKEKMPIAGFLVDVPAVQANVIENANTNKTRLVNVEVKLECDSEETATLVEDLKPFIQSKLIVFIQGVSVVGLHKAETRKALESYVKKMVDNRIIERGHKGSIKEVLITSLMFAG